MKRTLFLLAAALGLLSATPLCAQRGLPGRIALEAGAGLVDGFSLHDARGDYSYHVSIRMIRSNGNRTLWQAGFSYLHKDYRYRCQRIPKEQYTGEAGLLVPLLSTRSRQASLRLGLTAIAGYESSNRGCKLLYDGATLTDRDAFVWGGALSAEVAAYLSDRVELFAEVRERVLGGSTIGTFHTLVGIGLRITIN